MSNVIANSFVKRQTAASRFSHFNGSWGSLCDLVTRNWGKRKAGYREGVVLVPVPADGFYSGTVPLVAGMPLRATYEARRPGEDPRMHIGAMPPMQENGQYDYCGAKVPAVAVDVVLYASTVLAEDDGDNELPAEDGNWEVISVNARMCEDEEPIPPEALIANHLHESGGTNTQMTDSEFVAALRKSRAYWNQHVMLG